MNGEIYMIDFPPLNTTPTISSRVRGVYLAQESGHFKAPSFVPGILERVWNFVASWYAWLWQNKAGVSNIPVVSCIGPYTGIIS